MAVKESSLKVWLNQIRAPFLILAVVLVLIGIAAAHYEGYFHFGHATLLMVGVVLAHVSVNLFNELSDYHTGIDLKTTRTPFSGGSGMLQSGRTSTIAVSFIAYASLGIAAAIGLYFYSVRGWLIMIFMILGAFAIRFYTSILSRWLLGEFFSGLTLGSSVILGAYYVLTGKMGIEIIFLSIPPGILTALLLFLNEFPDAEADEKGGRYHLVIYFGRRRCSVIYMISLISVYVMILGISFLKNVPASLLVALIVLPLAAKSAITVLKYYNNQQKLITALGMNVGVVIFTDFLLAVGFFIA